MPSEHYVHPEFGYLAPTSRWPRDLKVAVISIFFGAIAGAGGLTVLTADHNGKTDVPSTSKRVEAPTAEPRSDPGPGAQPTQQASRSSLPTTETTSGTVGGAKPGAPETDGKSNIAKPDAGAASGSNAACDESTWSAGKCVPQEKPRRLRVRAANEAPAIGRTPVGRSTASSVPAASGSDDPPGSASPPEGAQAKSTDAAIPAEPPAPSAAPAKTSQKRARSHSRRRDQHRIDAPSWREVREDGWSAGSYTDYPNERYRRGADRHEGRYVRDGFWSW